MTFENIYFLIIPSAILFLFFLFKKYLIWKEIIYTHFGNTFLYGNKPMNRSLTYSKLSFVALSLSIILLSIALAKPKLLSNQFEIEASETEIILAIDCSLSMIAEDIPSDRFSIAKRLALELLDRTRQDISLVSFSSLAQVEVPPTLNHNSIATRLESLSPEDYLPQGSNLEVALIFTSQLFSDISENKILVVLSDGEFHDGNIKKGTEALVKSSIVPFFISIGTEIGSEINILGSKETTKANHTVMKNAALEANGYHFKISDANELLEISNISETIANNANVMIRNEYINYSNVFFVISFVLLMIFWKI